MNLGTWRIVIIVSLVITGIAVLANGFVDQGEAVAGTVPSSAVTPTESPPPTAGGSPTDPPAPTETPKPNTKNVLFMVFNGTDATGLGGEVQQLLEADAYEAPEPADDAPVKPVKRTIVYFRAGDDEEQAAQAKADATYVSETYFDGQARVEVLAETYQDLVPSSVQVVIVVGEDYAAANAA